jgi:hypothetical protein
MSQPETLFKQRVLKDLDKIKGCWVLKTQERARHGVPDLLICLRGKFVAIELKIDGEYPTPLQDEILERIQAASGTAFFTTPTLWKTHQAMLQELAQA